MATKDPLGALDFVSDYAETNAFPELAGTLARYWALIDPVQATDFMTRLDSSPARDNALKQAAESYRYSDPDLALQWISQMSDAVGNVRLERAERIIMSSSMGYTPTVPEQIAMLERSPLPPADKAKLLEKLRQ